MNTRTGLEGLTTTTISSTSTAAISTCYMLGLIISLESGQHTTATSATAISTTSSAATGTTFGSLIDSDSTAIEPEEVSM